MRIDKKANTELNNHLYSNNDILSNLYCIIHETSIVPAETTICEFMQTINKYVEELSERQKSVYHEMFISKLSVANTA